MSRRTVTGVVQGYLLTFMAKKNLKKELKMSIKLSAEVQKRIAKENYYSETDFVNDAKAYIAAVKSGRILCFGTKSKIRSR